jgi:hypothetical protein
MFNFCTAMRAPVILDAIRDAVTDLGRTTQPFATAGKKSTHFGEQIILEFLVAPTQVAEKHVGGAQRMLLRNLGYLIISK